MMDELLVGGAHAEQMSNDAHMGLLRRKSDSAALELWYYLYSILSLDSNLVK